MGLASGSADRSSGNRFLQEDGLALLQRVDFGNGEEVVYTPGVSEAKARQLGDALRMLGLFDGQGAKTVQLSRSGLGFEVSVVVKDGDWNKPEVVSWSRMIHGRLAKEVFEGGPLVIKLCDEFMISRQTIEEGLGERLTFGANEEVFYAPGVTEKVARGLGSELQKAGFFDGKGSTTVVLAKEGRGFRVSFVVKKGTWDDAEALDSFQALHARLAKKVFSGQPVEICLCDQALVSKRTIK
jgi:hypothetical protein